MALSILRNIARNDEHGVSYIVMANEVIDSSNKIGLRWVYNDLNQHKEFIVLHEVPNISASTHVSCIGDALICMNL